MRIDFSGDSGRIYRFDTDLWPNGVGPAAGLYVVLRPPVRILEHLDGRPNVLYVGQSDDLVQQTVEDLYSHHRFGDFRLVGAIDIAVWYAGPEDDIAAAEMDLKRSLNPHLTDQPTGILKALIVGPDHR